MLLPRTKGTRGWVHPQEYLPGGHHDIRGNDTHGSEPHLRRPPGSRQRGDPQTLYMWKQRRFSWPSSRFEEQCL
ncbi:uncharacterized protein B0H18DRAFT_56259 [Fomitopsis serialis]|uniref:uncharacterized protein n=1 Tax=Fomitopsis serialis TaxID=139415 RepID=UPI002007CF54|nr:uncharacterized protein B0H18DRAFT_56259 [Neoantrodia serialis]KAH9916859.1 hypothetical protein B0H18DRAFT_56259 [Neoantrodia serialis]